jgi:signal transduction histidine kinase
MRIAAGMWLIYLTCLLVIDLFIYAGRPASPVLGYYLVNYLVGFLFLSLAIVDPLSKGSRKIITGIMILLISAAPILVQQLFNLRLPPAPLSNLEGMILRQLPVLMIGLVLVAWHYSLTVMVIYSIAINLLEISLVILFNRMEVDRFMSFYIIVLVRMVCFIVVGIFVNRLISSLRAQQEALKLANQQLTHYASTLETLTISRERNRMSRELHDTAVHTLSGLSVQLETAKAYFEISPETAKRLVDQSLEAARSGLQDTRRALKAMRASPLDDLGFGMAFQKMLETAAVRGNFALEVMLPEQPLLFAPDVEQCIYRIAQEAVENVVHHANAKHLCARVTVDGEDVALVIQDDGIGFDIKGRILPGHFGISGMKERAALAGGVLMIQSMAGSGTTIQLAIKGYRV